MFVMANLSEEQLEALKAFEEKEAIKLIAFADIDLEPKPLAADQVAEISELERQLGVCLLAVK